MRWRIVIRAASWGLDDGKLISAEEKRDNSDEGQRFALTARTSFNSSTVKSEAWATFINPETDNKMSYHTLAAAFAGFRWPHQLEVTQEYTNKFFDVVKEMFAKRTVQVAMAFVEYLFPWNPSDKSIVERTEKFLGTLTDEPIITRALREKIDDVKRASSCYQLYEK